MNFREKLLFKALPLSLAFFFGMMLFGMIFKPGIRDGWMPLHIAKICSILIYAIVILLIWSVVIKWIRRNSFSRIREKRFLLVFFTILIVAQGLFLSQINLPMEPQCISGDSYRLCAWDFNSIAQGAADAVKNGSTSADVIDYLHRHQNNIPIFYLLKTTFSAAMAIGITNFQLIGTILNILAINLSILLIYLAAKRLFGVKKAIFSLIVSVSILPMVFIYLPIFYTDTLSMLFPIAIIYLYSIYRDNKDKKKAFWLIPAIAVLAFVGSMIKFSVMIILIAIMIDMLFHTRKDNLKRTILSLLTIIALTASLLLVYGKLADIHIHNKAAPHSITTPWTHYLMMGLGGNGQYSVDDDVKTSSHSTEQSAVDYNMDEIKKRLEDLGLLYPYFLYFKAIGTWTEGTYESLYRLGNMNIESPEYHPSALQKVIVSRDETKPFAIQNLMNAVHALMIIAIIIGSIKSYAGQNKDRLRATMQLTILGLIIFLLVWETNPRYIVNFLPILALLALSELYSMAPLAIDSIKKYYLAARMKILKY